MKTALLGLLLAAGVAAAGDLSRFAPDEPHYFAEFDPRPVPWRPAEEMNIEEVFKNYEYYELRFDRNRTDITVHRIVRGQPRRTQTFRRLENGALEATGGSLEPAAAPAAAVPDGSALYATHCASCHGADRLGRSGPALLPSSLARLGRKRAAQVIADGRPATQMPGFSDRLPRPEIDALVARLFSEPDTLPRWRAAEIRGSHVVYERPAELADKPVFAADPLNLFLVVEAGDHHVTVLDGDRFEPIYRFPTRFSLHGGLKYSPDGRFVYLTSRDGWISKFDLYNLVLVAEIRAGINTRNAAVSDDGRYVLVGNYLPGTLVLLDARDLSLIRVIPARGAGGKPSRVSAVYQAAPRHSFVVALKDVPEVWELRYDGTGVTTRRISLPAVLDDFFFDPPYRHVIGADRAGGKGQVIDLDSGAVVATLDLPGMPHLGSGISWRRAGRWIMATPHLKEGMVSFIDMSTWKVIKRVRTLGPGFFIRSHDNTPYAWVDVFFGPDRDAMQVIDKRSLEIVKTLRPAPGKTSAHVEFNREGTRALVSIWDTDGAVVVYDAATLREISRLPMSKPSGKYNVYNKITRSPGTSH